MEKNENHLLKNKNELTKNYSFSLFQVQLFFFTLRARGIRIDFFFSLFCCMQFKLAHVPNFQVQDCSCWFRFSLFVTCELHLLHNAVGVCVVNKTFAEKCYCWVWININEFNPLSFLYNLNECRKLGPHFASWWW